MTFDAHILVIAVALLSMGFVARLLRKRQVRAKYAILWVSIGVVMLILAAWPHVIDYVSIWLGVSYGPTTVFLGAITVLFMIVVHFSWELSRLEARSRRVAEELALTQLELDKLRDQLAEGAVESPGTRRGVPRSAHEG